MKIGVIRAIRFYQKFISPMFGSRCIYYPTCSQYTLEAINKYGFLTGGWLGAKRLIKCGPWSKGGHDPVK